MSTNRIQIMISSRCEDSIRKAGRGSVKLTGLRMLAKEENKEAASRRVSMVPGAFNSRVKLAGPI